MLGNGSDRKPHSGRSASARRGLAAAALLAGLAAAVSDRAADGLWDTVLEKMNLKAEPAAPAPGFVERTRPDPADLGYQPTALNHKVSPVPVKTAAEIAAAKGALDAAKARQLDPGAPKPLQPAKGSKAAKGRPSPAASD